MQRAEWAVTEGSDEIAGVASAEPEGTEAGEMSAEMDVEGLKKRLREQGREWFMYGEFTSYEAGCKWQQLIQDAEDGLRQQAEEIERLKRPHTDLKYRYDLIERLRHCEENADDAYLRELAGRAAEAICSLDSQAEEVERLRKQVSADGEQLQGHHMNLRRVQEALGMAPYSSLSETLDRIAALTRQLQEAVEARDRYRESLERIHLRAAPGPDDRNFDRCIQDLMWCDDEARRALTERSKP